MALWSEGDWSPFNGCTQVDIRIVMRQYEVVVTPFN